MHENRNILYHDNRSDDEKRLVGFYTLMVKEKPELMLKNRYLISDATKESRMNVIR
jgi:hypothetical protein